VSEQRSISELKQYALKLPEPVKTLVLSCKDKMSEDEFLVKFLEWRKILKMEAERK
jgi:hypothetical protein